MTIKIIELIDLDMAYVRSEALKVLGSVVRVFPALRAHLLPNLPRYLRTIEDPDARSVIVWMLGEFGEEVVEAPYVLESVIDEYGQEVNVNLKLQMLSSAMKLFYKRPPEMQAMLGRLLTSAVNDNSNQDVHDKALLYYRLLTTNTAASAKLFTNANTDSLQSRIAAGGHFAEDANEELLDQLFAEFNTLAVIYGKPSKQFIGDEFLFTLRDAEARRDERMREAASLQHAATSVVDHGLNDLSLSGQTAAGGGAEGGGEAEGGSSSSESVNLLDWGDDSPAISSHQPAATPPSLALDGAFVLAPPDFQQHWGSFAEAPLPSGGLLCCLAALPDDLAEVEQGMAEVNVSVQDK
jgi:AP-4 complex subunit beta-1